jgi:hypothetical protein
MGVSELSFLLDLLLEHELPQEVKRLVAERLKYIEAQRTPVVGPKIVHQPAHQGAGGTEAPPAPTTAAASAALASRAELIAQAVKGNAPMKNRGFK